ncbi:ScbA/BarX family gamma-butyrolactone biosynthesis protein [Streptomyces jumonjinensis]|uniref:A-factor biosynthesis hotdog domain-containing protein n=1 Tax=Streptomyces jumonjinensis TaxID=1945 RepID=A0A646KR16_STRJU|nr:ScbA/BarX family gamma-butyrolactone biosynthesis protein [Streptomyces jumonjinensis]MQT04742.1 hypothetical protein [Streptomyces jumonjinensis]
MTSPNVHGSAVLHSRQPTARQLVRKVDSTEVLVADWRSVSDVQHVVTTEWPCAHSFYTADPESHTPLLFTESLRQALVLLSHTAFDIPLDHRLGWEYISSTITGEGLRTAAEPARVELHITHTTVNRRRQGSSRMTAEVEAVRDGRPVGSAQLRYTSYPEAIYRRVRGHYANAADCCARALPPGPPADPALVGRRNERDVVLSPTDRARVWRLRTDLTHPVLFDHPHDHIPGMVLLEAFDQAALAAGVPHRVRPLSFDTVFNRYVELNQPCLIEADVLDLSTVKLVATQNDAVAASALVTVAPI